MQTKMFVAGGSRQFGRLGDGETTGSLGTVSDVVTLADDSDLPDVIQMSVGISHNCVLTEDKDVWCWGSNANGEMGFLRFSKSSLPKAYVQGKLCWGYRQHDFFGRRDSGRIG